MDREPRAQLSPADRGMIVGMLSAGHTVREIAKEMRVNRSTVYYCAKRFREGDGSLETKPRSGRPRCTSSQEDQYVIQKAVKPLTMEELTSIRRSLSNECSYSTIRRRIQEAGILNRKPAKKPSVTRCDFKRNTKTRRLEEMPNNEDLQRQYPLQEIKPESIEIVEDDHSQYPFQEITPDATNIVEDDHSQHLLTDIKQEPMEIVETVEDCSQSLQVFIKQEEVDADSNSGDRSAEQFQGEGNEVFIKQEQVDADSNSGDRSAEQFQEDENESLQVFIKQEEVDADSNSGDRSAEQFQGDGNEVSYGPILLKYEVLPFGREDQPQEKSTESEANENLGRDLSAVTFMEDSIQESVVNETVPDGKRVEHTCHSHPVRRMNSKGIKRKALTLKEKLDVIKTVESNPSCTRLEMAKKLNMAVSTINGIMSRKEVLNSNALDISCKVKRRRNGKYEDVEKALVVWFKQTSAANVPVNGNLLREKGIEIADRLGVDFIPSNGWIDRFKKRFGLVYKVICGESSSVNKLRVDECRKSKLYVLIKQYRKCDIFNVDELGLFYNLLPNKTFAFKGQNCHSGKLSKERITVLVGANMDGSEKLPLFVIGKPKKPRCFNNVKTLPCKYRSNKTAWMTCALFDEYLRALDSKMAGKNRKILLFVDNCPAHPKNNDHLKNVHVEFFPGDSTSVVQPMDQGVIKVLKLHFRKYLVHKLLTLVKLNGKAEKFKISMLDAMHYLAASWDTVSPTVVINSFKKAGFYDDIEENVSAESDEEEQEIPFEGWDLLQSNLGFTVNFNDYVDVDNDVITCELRTIEDICNEGQNMTDSESEQEDEPAVPTFQDAMTGFSSLQQFIHSVPDVPESVLKCVREIDLFCMKLSPKYFKQSSLDSYFKKL